MLSMIGVIYKISKLKNKPLKTLIRFLLNLKIVKLMIYKIKNDLIFIFLESFVFIRIN
jgi:hypothetical protein